MIVHLSGWACIVFIIFIEVVCVPSWLRLLMGSGIVRGAVVS